jgi:hypothetical protein
MPSTFIRFREAAQQRWKQKSDSREPAYAPWRFWAIQGTRGNNYSD